MQISTLLRQYIWLVDTIYREAPITFKDLAYRWERSYLNEGKSLFRSTFNRHREAVQDLFDLDISCKTIDGNYFYYIENDTDLRRNGIKKWMLDTISVGTIVNESKHLKSRIMLENVPSGQSFLTIISRAMQNGVTLKMVYQQFDKEPRTVEVEPYCLKLYHQRWYMLARKIDREWLIVYALDRIKQMEETSNTFELPKDFDVNEHFADNFGVLKDDTPKEHVVIRATRKLANYYRTLPLHHTQKEVCANDKYVEFTVDLCPTYDFRQEIFSQIPDIEIVSPEWLRVEMKKSLKEALDKFGG